MVRAVSVILLVALGGCAGVAGHRWPASACDAGEASYACQVERYHNVSVP